MKDLKHLYWVVGLILITVILCGTLIWINLHSWTIRFEMDDNTLEAIEFINWSFNSENWKDNLHTCFNEMDGTWLESNCNGEYLK